MFSYIDSRLISVAQWFIRQLELFFPITRENVITFTLNVTKWLIVVSALLSLLSAYFDIWGAIFTTIAYSFYQSHRLLVLVYSLQKKSSNSLPQEIVTRKLMRKILVCGLIPSSLPLGIVILSHHAPFFWSAITLPMFLFVFVLFIVSEYLLCTTSLPPGGKEKRKIEKELRSATSCAV